MRDGAVYYKAALMASDSLITQISSPTSSSRGRRRRRAVLLHVDRIGHPAEAAATASAARWLYAFGAPYALQCYMALKRVRRRKLLETPCAVVVAVIVGAAAVSVTQASIQ